MSRTLARPYKYVERSASLLWEALYGQAPPARDDVEAALVRLLQSASVPFSRREKRLLQSAGWQRPPPELVPRLMRDLGKVLLNDWAKQHFPRLKAHLGDAGLAQLVGDWLDALPEATVTALHRAVIGHTIEPLAGKDAEIRSKLGEFLSAKEATMNPAPVAELVGRLLATNGYFFDTGNALPESFKNRAAQEAYITKVAEILRRFTLDITKSENDYIVAAIVGILLQLGRTQLDPASAFEADVRQAWARLFTTELGNALPNNEIYKSAGVAMRADRSGASLSFQEFAFAGGALSTGETRVAPGDPNFAGLVRVTAQDYLAQRTTFGGQGDFPPLYNEDVGDNENEPDNIRAVAWVYAAYQYEQMRMFDVVDRITELFMNGLLPVGLDAGGQALDRYYWDSEERLTAPARHSHYTRVLGAAGGDISREVQPNTGFNSTWMRFLSSIAEYDRQYRMADLFQQRRGLATTGEHVRKAGRDLAANASLYGWAATHFIARRLERQIRETINILRLPSIQKAYAVNSPWQVIERVAATEFGQAPNMVRYDTMARAGKMVLDIVANNGRVWGRTAGTPLFTDNSNPARHGDISDADRDTLMTQTQYWLAVNGIQDTEIDQLSQPVATVAAPSIPATGKAGAPDLDQLRQMVTAGQMPSLDQLQRIVGVNGVPG